jgi:hypothetical protein
METDTIVRARRRRQALDALDTERDREAALREQLDEMLTELEGARIDAVAFARMDPADVELVRETLDPLPPLPEDEWQGLEGESPAETARLQREEREEREAECARLRQVIERCRRCQGALERYLEAMEP